MIPTPFRRTVRGVGAVGVAALLGCAPPDAAPTSDRGTASVGPLPLATSVNAVMVGLIDHAAHHIWDVAREEMAPSTDEEWDEVMHHSIQLMAGATAITAGGTGRMDAEWVRDPAWRQFSASLGDAGSEALEAANARDLDGVIRAGDVLIEACEGCHTAFKPELPTEGLVHPHR